MTDWILILLFSFVWVFSVLFVCVGLCILFCQVYIVWVLKFEEVFSKVFLLNWVDTSLYNSKKCLRFSVVGVRTREGNRATFCLFVS